MRINRYYKGPELSALLDDVRRELGTEATIVEANKVRSGGIAGFFSKETFEVVAAGTDDPPIVDEETTSVVERAPSEIEMKDEVEDDRSAAASPLPQVSRTATAQSAAGTVTTALLERADAVSVHERVDLTVPNPNASNGPSFEDILSAELALVEERAMPEFFDFDAAAEIDELVPDESATDDTSIIDAVEIAPPAATAHQIAPPINTAAEIAPPALATDDPFWEQLDRFTEVFSAQPVLEPIVTVVGSASAAIELARLLQADEPHTVELSVVSETRTAAVPSWDFLVSEDEVSSRINHWVVSSRRGVMAIDSTLPSADLHVHAATNAGAGVIHLAVGADMSLAELHQQLDRFGSEVIVDFLHRPDPSLVMGLIDQGVVVSRVAGHKMDASLMLALATQVDNG